MKKIFTLGVPALALMLTAVSCSKDGDFKQTFKVGVNALNLITSVDDNSTFVNTSAYSFNIKNDNGTWSGSVSSSDIAINNSVINFQTEEVLDVAHSQFSFEFKNLTGTITGGMSQPLTSGYFFLTDLSYTPGAFNIVSKYPLQRQVTVSHYNIGNLYTVKTFQLETFFYGKTVTQYPNKEGVSVSFSPEDTDDGKKNPMIYQLSLDMENKTATVYIYNAKFAQESPKLTLVKLEDLTPDFSGGKVKVTGSNIVPQVVEGTSTTPFPLFTFNEFEFITTSADLVDCEIKYTVAEKYKGQFTGSYIMKEKQQ